MLLVDFSAVWMSSVTAMNLPPEEDMLRHVILNSLRSYNVKFGAKYGPPILCCDHYSWRREYFPEYKYSRRESRKAENADTYWNDMYKVVDIILNEIQHNIPWKVIRYAGAEGDDVIGVLALSTQEFGKGEDVLIVAADSDYKQLLKYNNVRQWSPIKKKFIKEALPHKWLFETTIRGQAKDGIPNVLSDDETFITKTRQKPITKKKLELWWDNRNDLGKVMTPRELRNFDRNNNLMNFEKIPTEIKYGILEQYEKYKVPLHSDILTYLVMKRCRNLIDKLNDFKDQRK